MTPSQLEKFRTILTELLRQTVSGTLAAVHDATAADTGQDEPQDVGDTAELDVQRDARYLMGEREANLAMKIEAALQRITRGEFGVCVDCGNPIEPERLRAVPWTERCIDDETRHERVPPPSL